MGAARLVNADRLPPDRPPPGRRRPADPRRATDAGRPTRARPAAGRHAGGGPRSAAEGWDVAEGWGHAGGSGRPGPDESRARADRDRDERPDRGRRRPAREVRARLPFWDRLLRGLAGVLAGGLVVLSLGLLVVWLLADGWGVPGPGGKTVSGHLVGAVVAVAGQRLADRRPDRTGTLAAAVVVGTAVLVLSLAWFL